MLYSLSVTTAPTCLEIHPEFTFDEYATCIHLSIGVGKTIPGCIIKLMYLTTLYVNELGEV